MNTKITSCFFLDVGQGSCSVVITPDCKVILIDAGPVSQGVVFNFVADLLEDCKSIHAVVLSHNDNDHIRGFEKIAQSFGRKISTVYALEDRRNPNKGFDAILSLVKRQIIRRLERAEVRNMEKPLKIYKSKILSVDLIYPDFAANAQSKGTITPKSNQTSAICRVISNQQCRVLLPGDSTKESWDHLKSLKSKAQHLPIKTDILALPHHGGKFGEKEEDFEWFLNTCVNCRFAVVSAGSDNKYDHPNPGVISVCRRKGVTVLCTEITPSCDSQHKNHNPGVSRHLGKYAASLDMNDQSRIGCAGTIIARIDLNETKIERLRHHQWQVDSKVEKPLCRKK